MCFGSQPNCKQRAGTGAMHLLSLMHGRAKRDFPVAYLLFLWALSPFAGMVAAREREAGCLGFLLGLLFGPIGVFAALHVDGRASCPRCGVRVFQRAEICPRCHTELT